MEKGCFGSGVISSDRGKIGGQGQTKERGGPDSGAEPYDARVYTLELGERDPKKSSRRYSE